MHTGWEGMPEREEYRCLTSLEFSICFSWLVIIEKLLSFHAKNWASKMPKRNNHEVLNHFKLRGFVFPFGVGERLTLFAFLFISPPPPQTERIAGQGWNVLPSNSLGRTPAQALFSGHFLPGHRVLPLAPSVLRTWAHSLYSLRGGRSENHAMLAGSGPCPPPCSWGWLPISWAVMSVSFKGLSSGRGTNHIFWQFNFINSDVSPLFQSTAKWS